MQRADQHCNDQGGTSRGEGLKHRNANKFFTYLYLVAMWWVEGVGSRCWLVWAPVVSQGRREPCQKCLSTAASLRYSPPAYKVMVEPPAETCKFTHAQTTQLFFSFFFFCIKAREEEEDEAQAPHRQRQEITRLQGQRDSTEKEKRRVFTRGRGMLQPSLGLGGRRAGLAGGGVSSPVDKLDSGELIGVRVTEEISRQESDLMLWHQKREDGLCSMYASLAAFMCSG